MRSEDITSAMERRLSINDIKIIFERDNYFRLKQMLFEFLVFIFYHI